MTKLSEASESGDRLDNFFWCAVLFLVNWDILLLPDIPLFGVLLRPPPLPPCRATSHIFPESVPQQITVLMVILYYTNVVMVPPLF